MSTESDRQFRTVVGDMSFTEGPRWHDGRLWFSDFYTHQVISVRESGDDVRVEATVEHQPSGLGWLPDGRLLVVSALDKTLLVRQPDGSLDVVADLSGMAQGQLNDMVVDASGRAYIGNFGFDLMGGATPANADVIRVDPDGSVSVAAAGLAFPNGSVITPDGATMIIAETMGNRLAAFDVDGDGNLSNRRTWASFGPEPDGTDVGSVLGQLVIAPDGICLDAEGAIWLADAVGGRAVRVLADGSIVDEVSPGTGVFACMLGGEDGTTLFLCTAPDFDSHARSAAREAAVVATTVSVPRAGLP